MSHAYEQALAKVLDAATAGNEGPGPLSTGEALMAALALNRPDWLARMGYTIVEAMERIGDEWLALLPRVAREVLQHQAAGEEAKRVAEEALAITQAAAAGGGNREEPVRFAAKLVTTGSAPGYRDASLTFELQSHHMKRPLLAELRLRPQDGESIFLHIWDVHKLAWQGHPPLDVGEAERRPRWLDLKC